MQYVLIPLSLIGFAYEMMQDFVWMELLTGEYLTLICQYFLGHFYNIKFLILI
jgi:hypothetical protein